MNIAGSIVKNQAKNILFKVIVIAISTIVLMTMVDFLAYSHYRKYEYFSSCNVDYAILFAGEYQSDTSYIYCDTNILCYSEEITDEAMSLEVLMQKSNSSADYVTQFYQGELSENEIVLPQKIAKKFNIERGDVIYLDVGYSVSRVAYSVKDVAPDVPSVFGDSSTAIALIGFSEQYCANVIYTTIYFYQGAIGDLTLGSSYVKSVDVRSVAEQEMLVFVAYLAVYTALLAVLTVVLVIVSDNEVRASLLKLKYLGYKRKNILLVKLLINIICLCPLIVIPLIFAPIYGSALLLCATGCALTVLIVAISLISDGRKYRSIRGVI